MVTSISATIPLNPERLLKLISQVDLFQVPLDAGWTEAVTGSGVTTQALSYLQVSTGITASSTARRYALLRNMAVGVAVWSKVHWDKKLYVYLLLSRLVSEAESIARFQIKEATTEGILAAAGIGLQFDNLALTGESYGSSRGTVDLSTTLTASAPVRVKIVLDPAVSVEFFVDDVSKGTITTAAAIPTGEEIASMMVSIKNGVTGGTATDLKIQNLWLGQLP